MKYLYLLLILLVLSRVCTGQDIAPGQQAQGYLNDKNATVDYSTGTFHYKVPLYTLNSGGFQLPVSLDYTAKGVRQGDNKGLIGYNWTLNTGGIVTRTLRGGFADEQSDVGYIWASATPLAQNVASVNKRLRDGESDIFTAIFNGQSINFIIRADQNNKIIAEPLERTNVRIECEPLKQQEIQGWIVTDENGNRYIYRQQERTSNIVMEDAISFNGIRNKSYISSWHLSRIEPYNGAPVILDYADGAEMNSSYRSSYQAKYTYGNPMQEHTFDFSKYESDFWAAIDIASSYLNGFSIEMQVNGSLNRYVDYRRWIENPDFEMAMETFNTNFRIMGLVASLSNISSASSELIQILGNLESTYQNQSSHNAQMAAIYLGYAKNYIISSLKETDYITTKETSGGEQYSVNSPLLNSITCMDKIIEFQYRAIHSKYLTGIRYCNLLKNRISEIRISQSNTLDELYFLDKDSVETGCMKFDYYTAPPNCKGTWDQWGYLRQKLEQPDEQYLPYVDQQFSKVFSLKTITLPDGGKITADYESNYALNKFHLDYESLLHAYEYGGIRIKSLVFDDYFDIISDTVRYEYPYPGIPVYDDYDNSETICYSGFSDLVVYSQMRYKGVAFLNKGNNGIYYRYVREIMPGKGINAYLFHVTMRYPETAQYNEPYAFWLNGLPLATAAYDAQGHLKRIIKNRYYTDFSFVYMGNSYLNFNDEYFEPGDTPVKYNLKMPQVKIYEYYMDAGFLSNYYQSQRNVLLYRDGSSSYSINPYQEIYLPNIQPRTTVVLPGQYYDINYGGKTLLKEQLEYRYESRVTDGPGFLDFSAQTAGIPYQKTTYFYDNLHHSLNPTRITKTLSDGEVYTTVIKRVTEIDNTADPVIAKMKQDNVLSYVIKQANLKNDILLDETVSLFDVLEADGRRYTGLSKKYTYMPEEKIAYSFSAIDRNLFTYGLPAYFLEQTIEYKQEYGLYLPIDIKERAAQSTVSHDFGRGQAILKVKNTEKQHIAVADMKKFNDLKVPFGEVNEDLEIYNAFQKFYNLYLSMEAAPSAEYQKYAKTVGFQMIIYMIKVVATQSSPVNFDQMNTLTDSICANDYRYITMFIDAFNTGCFGPEITMDEIGPILTIIMDRKMTSPDFFKNLYLKDYKYLLYDDAFSITLPSLPASGRIKLYVLMTNRYGRYISYSVKHAGGISRGNINVPYVSGYNLAGVELDLSPYTNVTSVTVDKPDLGADFLALVPVDAEFEATSYNADGTVFCKFNQNCQLERYEYDSAGRLSKTFDEDNNLLLENKYNDFLTQ